MHMWPRTVTSSRPQCGAPVGCTPFRTLLAPWSDYHFSYSHLEDKKSKTRSRFSIFPRIFLHSCGNAYTCKLVGGFHPEAFHPMPAAKPKGKEKASLAVGQQQEVLSTEALSSFAAASFQRSQTASTKENDGSLRILYGKKTMVRFVYNSVKRFQYLFIAMTWW
jgi:hypothetical protein